MRSQAEAGNVGPWGRFIHRRWRSLRSSGSAVFAYLYRRLLFRTKFIAITGSAGKTIAKELVAHILAAHFKVHVTLANANNSLGFSRTILTTSPLVDYAIVETAIGSRLNMSRQARMLQPHIVVLLAIQPLHINMFKSLEGIAAEKGQLLDGMSGSQKMAIVNADCALARAEAEKRDLPVVSFGYADNASVRATEAECLWPGRLAFNVHYQGKAYPVQTRLLGVHWVGSLLAAMAVGLQCGLSIDDVIASAASFEPTGCRMQPVYLPDYEATIIRDERSAGRVTFDAAFRFMAEAKAPRRIAVLSGYSEPEDSPEVVADWLASRLAGWADEVLFVNDPAGLNAKAAVRHGMSAETVHQFKTATEAGTYLRSMLQQGDLVLLKGRRRDHLSRAYLRLLGEVGCNWHECQLAVLCDRCGWLDAVIEPKNESYMISVDAF